VLSGQPISQSRQYSAATFLAKTFVVVKLPIYCLPSNSWIDFVFVGLLWIVSLIIGSHLEKFRGSQFIRLQRFTYYHAPPTFIPVGCRALKKININNYSKWFELIIFYEFEFL